MPSVFVALLLSFQSAATQGPVTPEAIQARVRATVDTALPRAIPDLRAAFADRLGAPLLRDPASDRVPGLLDGLAQAMAFHTMQVQVYEIDSGIPGLPAVRLPDGLLEEGYQLQMDYLTARIDRAVRVDQTEDTRTQIADQIRRLTTAGREILRSKLPGDPGAQLADREMDAAAGLWLKSLDMPYHQFMDTPLSQNELDQVLNRLTEAAAGFAPATLTAAQSVDPETLRSLGVADLLERVLQAASASTAFCYRDLGRWERRFEEWKVRAKTCRNDEAARAFRNYAPRPPEPAKSLARRAGAEPPATILLASRLPENANPKPDPTGSASTLVRRTAASFTLAALVLIALVFVLRRSRAAVEQR